MLIRTQTILNEGVEHGLHLGAQVYVSIDGKPVGELAIGESRPGVAMTTDSLSLWLSSTKPIAAVAIMQLVERGKLALDDRVAEHIPEFAAGGKQDVTIRHLLTHTAGFRWVDVAGPETPWEEIVAHICAAKLERDWPLGLRAAYHPMTSWFILGELVGRTSGKHFRDCVRSEIFLPLGMNDSWIGMPAERFLDYGDRIAIMSEMDKPDRPPYRYSLLAGATACFPGANGYGPARELARIYEMLLGQGEYNGTRILQASSVEQMTARQRQGMYDETFKHVMDWGLGLILNSARYGADTVPYGYGPYASDNAFGHSGSQSSVAFADPEQRLAIAAVMNGMPGEGKHQRRIRAVCAAIYEDLELSS